MQDPLLIFEMAGHQTPCIWTHESKTRLLLLLNTSKPSSFVSVNNLIDVGDWPWHLLAFVSAMFLYLLSSPVLCPQEGLGRITRDFESVSAVPSVACIDLHITWSISVYICICIPQQVECITLLELCGLTTGPGADFSLHITHGTPVLSSTAMLPAHCTYLSPASLYAWATLLYSFSTCCSQFLLYVVSAEKQELVNWWTNMEETRGLGTCERMIGPPWEAKSFSSFIRETTFSTNLFIWYCTQVTSVNTSCTRISCFISRLFPTTPWRVDCLFESLCSGPPSTNMETL